MIVGLDGLTDDSRIAAEALLPELVAENYEWVLVLDPTFIWSKRAAKGRLNAEGGEVVAADQIDPSTLGTALGAKIDGRGRVDNEVRKNGLKLAVVFEIGIGKVER